ncbi:MAG: hypothetical protein HFH93_10675 [Lachnospiraceae bacterium]|nr:hypothetical protein [Lachnospiraceae bacterium]
MTTLSSEAFAATLKDVFDEHYYADSYADLKEAFGYDRELLWNHFMTFGVNEGCTMNRFIDIMKYRAMYEDLDAAFGNDWDAYLEHYLTYGAKEGSIYFPEGNKNVLIYNADGTVSITGYNPYDSISFQETRDVDGNKIS